MNKFMIEIGFIRIKYELIFLKSHGYTNAYGRLPGRKVVARIGRLLLNTALLYISAYRKAIISVDVMMTPT